MKSPWKYLPMLLASFPEGYAVGLSIYQGLGWNIYVVAVAALVVAATGFYGVLVVNRLSEFNATLFNDEKSQKMALPVWKAWAVLGVWFVGVILLTVFLDVYPLLKTLTPVGLVVIGFCFNFLFSLNVILGKHEAEREKYRVGKRQDKENERAEKKVERKARQARAQELESLRKVVAQKLNTVQGPQVRRVQRRDEKIPRELLLMEWAMDPYLGPSQMQAILLEKHKIEVSHQAISLKKSAMVKEGIIRVEPDGAVSQLLISSAAESPPV